MKKMKVTNELLLPLVASKEMHERISVLLEKHYGIQMANIWKFGISTGLRLSEILTIKLESISREKASLTRHKARTGEIQEVILPSKALKIANSIKKAHPNSEYLFQSHRSRNVTSKKPMALTRQAVSLAFREVGKILDMPLTPHLMRQVYMVQSLGQLAPSERKLMKHFLIKT